MRRRGAARNLENAKQNFDPTSRWYRSCSAPRPNAAADSRRLADARQGASSKRQCQTGAACAPNPALTGRPMSSTGLRSDTATGCGKTWKETTDETHEPDARSHVVDLSAAPPRRGVETGGYREVSEGELND